MAAKKRVSWEVVESEDVHLDFATRKQAIEQVRKRRPVGVNRWEQVGDGQPTFAPVDLDVLLAMEVVTLYKCLDCGKRRAKEWGFPCGDCLERMRQEHVHILSAPPVPLPAEVLLDGARALQIE